MNIVFTTACCYPSRDPIRMLIQSCRKFGVDLRPYGVGYPSNDWIDVKVTKLLDALRILRNEDFTHVLYTDGIDSLFAAFPIDIVRWYEHLGSPACLMSAERECYPYPDMGMRVPESSTIYRYPCAGQFMGEIDWIIDRWQKLRSDYAADSEANDQAWILKGFVDGVLDGMVLDYEQRVFQNVQEGDSEIRGCVLHFSGGYVCPDNGRNERMDPYWKRICER